MLDRGGTGFLPQSPIGRRLRCGPLDLDQVLGLRPGGGSYENRHPRRLRTPLGRRDPSHTLVRESTPASRLAAANESETRGLLRSEANRNEECDHSPGRVCLWCELVAQRLSILKRQLGLGDETS